MRQRTPRERDDAHLKFIRQLPCLVCGDNTSVEAAHIRFTDISAAKNNPGIGQKPSDYWTVPLCGRHHREQHGMSEPAFWSRAKIDALRVAAFLYLATGDHERGSQIVSEAR
jgi:hypothetical protein